MLSKRPRRLASPWGGTASDVRANPAGARASGGALHAVLVALLVVLAVDAGATTLRVLTLNLRANHDKPGEREAVIRRELKKLGADLLFFQEVAAPAARQVERVLPKGFTVVHRQNPDTGRGLAIASRHPIESSESRVLPGGRPALLAVIRVGKRRIAALNVHLRPQLDATRARVRELEAARDWLDSAGPLGILAGDVNFGDGAPENAALKGLVDSFRARQRRAAGFTWDTRRNPLAQSNGYATEKSRRLDRILLRGPLRPLRSSIVLARPFRAADGQRWCPSDHYAVLSSIKVPRR